MPTEKVTSHKDTPAVEFVTIPELDIFDREFPTIRLGRLEFKAGKTYEVAEPVTSSLKERIKAWQDADRRILQPRKDKAAMRVQAQRSTNAGLAGQPD